MANLSDALVAEAVEYLDRAELVERVERMGEAAVSARLVLTERRTLRGSTR